MDVKNQKFLILGVSKSGKAVCEYVLKKNEQCYVYEELNNPKIDCAINELISLGAKRVLGDEIDEVLHNIDVVVISPGVPINHEVAIKAKRLGKRILGEFEFGFLQCAPTTVAVTGTNGKTTTVSLIQSVLEKNFTSAKVVGNIGVPVTSEIDNIKNVDVVVAEVSSFQLETINSFCPHIACVLNISPDHLERHYNMENYIFLKRRLLKNQMKSEYCILNFDDETVKSFSETGGKVVWVSLKEKVFGAYRQNGKLFFNQEFIMEESDLSIFGEHNVYNALFTIAVCRLLGVSSEVISKALSEFKGVKHRIELVFEKDGKKYYNDSKSTNTASTMTAIDAMKSETILILGGSEKGEEYDNLFNKIKNSLVKHVILTGASRFNMLETAVKCGYSNITLTSNFYSAVKIANMFATDGDCILLSPACSSFDVFSGYEERGEAFVKTVGEL